MVQITNWLSAQRLPVRMVSFSMNTKHSQTTDKFRSVLVSSKYYSGPRKMKYAVNNWKTTFAWEKMHCPSARFGWTHAEIIWFCMCSVKPDWTRGAGAVRSLGRSLVFSGVRRRKFLLLVHRFITLVFLSAPKYGLRIIWSLTSGWAWMSTIVFPILWRRVVQGYDLNPIWRSRPSRFIVFTHTFRFPRYRLC